MSFDLSVADIDIKFRLRVYTVNQLLSRDNTFRSPLFLLYRRYIRIASVVRITTRTRMIHAYIGTSIDEKTIRPRVTCSRCRWMESSGKFSAIAGHSRVRDASRFDYYAIIIIPLASQFRNLFSPKERKSCGSITDSSLSTKSRRRRFHATTKF